MPRDRWRVTLDGGRKLDLAKVIPRGTGMSTCDISRGITYGSGKMVTVLIKLRDDDR